MCGAAARARASICRDEDGRHHLEGFSPTRVTIAFGDTVKWTNKDTVQHQVVADGAKFTSSQLIPPRQAYSFTFTKSGVFPYHDGVNARRKGTVVVGDGVSLTSTPLTVTYGGGRRSAGTYPRPSSARP